MCNGRRRGRLAWGGARSRCAGWRKGQKSPGEGEIFLKLIGGGARPVRKNSLISDVPTVAAVGHRSRRS